MKDTAKIEKKVPDGMIESRDWKVVGHFGTYNEAKSAGAALKVDKASLKIRLVETGFALKQLVGMKFIPGPRPKKIAAYTEAGVE